MNTGRIRPGTAAALASLAGAAGLKQGEIYLITDQGRLSVAMTTTTHEPMAKLSEAGGGSAVSRNFDGGSASSVFTGGPVFDGGGANG